MWIHKLVLIIRLNCTSNDNPFSWMMINKGIIQKDQYQTKYRLIQANASKCLGFISVINGDTEIQSFWKKKIQELYSAEISESEVYKTIYSMEYGGV